MKRALIIGGSRGIGRAIALEMANAGFDIWLTYNRSPDAAEEVKAEIEKIGRSCELFGFDVSDYDATQAALAERCEKEPPYAVIYNAGITRDNLMLWMSREEWDDVLKTNLDGFFNVTKAVLFPMLAQKKGRIVAISSTSGQVGQAGQVNYSASKAGLIGAVKALAREVGKKNILVNAVAPGVIDTEMTEHLPTEQILPLIPLGRTGTAQDVAATVRFLCSDEQSYIHGQVIGVNGGLAI
jgi:3-oxoacyl-[acyl-carrier protein] reductase